MTDPRLNAQGRFTASTEVSPRQALEKPEILQLVPRLTRVYLTDLGNASEDDIVRAALGIHDQHPSGNFADRCRCRPPQWPV